MAERVRTYCEICAAWCQRAFARIRAQKSAQKAARTSALNPATLLKDADTLHAYYLERVLHLSIGIRSMQQADQELARSDASPTRSRKSVWCIRHTHS